MKNKIGIKRKTNKQTTLPPVTNKVTNIPTLALKIRDTKFISKNLQKINYLNCKIS